MSYCTKTAYHTHGEAEKALKAFKSGRHHNRKMATKKPKRVYKCEICGMYHLTSQKHESVNRRTKEVDY